MEPQTCPQCGAVNPPPDGPPFQCRFCGVPMAAPELQEGRIWTTPEAILDFLRQELTGVDSTFVHPTIPPKKLAGQQKAHAAHLGNEPIIALYDGTAFGSATDGFVVTATRLLWKNQMEPASFLEWRHIDPDDVYMDDSTLVVGRARIDTLLNEDDDGFYAWSTAIDTIARSFRPPADWEVDQAQRAQEGPDPGWGGPEVAVGPAAGQGGAWGGMGAGPATGQAAWQIPTAAQQYVQQPEVERLPAQPYDAYESCEHVDVHPSGELIAAAGSSTVELRYAANGARCLAFATAGAVLSARFSPDGNWLLLGTSDHRANLYEVRTGQLRGRTEKMGDSCDEVVWLGQTHFVCGSQEGEVWVVDARSMQIVHRVLKRSADYDHLGGIAATTDGSRFFVSVGNKLGCFDAASGRIIWRNDNALQNASRLSMSPRGDALVAAGYDGVAFFDANTGQAGARLPYQAAQGLTWPEGGGGLLKRLKKDDDSMHWSWSARPAFSPTGEVVAVQDQTGNLNFVDVATATMYPTPRERGRAFIESIAWFRDGNHVALGMSDNTIAIWQARPLVGKLHAPAIQELPESAYANVPDDD